MSSIPTVYLRHLEYLRGLHLPAPRLGNTYLEDSALQSYLLPAILQNKAFVEELIRLGDSFSGKYLTAARDAERNPPVLEQFDSYGNRIDKLHLSEGWKTLGKYAAEDGIVALAYEKEDAFELKQHRRYAQLVILYMYQPSSGLYGCPLAMSDGAAYILRTLSQQVSSRKQYLEDAYNHLISRRDPWTSGQWMTEKKGGSDVSNTETIAVAQPGTDHYKLYGYKWFTSATDSQITLALAKIVPMGVEPTPDVLRTLKVSLFFIKVRNGEHLNAMEVIRLKDKLGTRQLPTAQLLLKGTQAQLISGEGNGVKMISKMLTITRIYNSSTAVGLMRRMLSLVKDYAARRTIGKAKLEDMPMQLRVISHMEVTHRANLTFYLKIAELFSKDQAGHISEDDANLLRLLTPILKLFTGKEAVTLLSEGVQSFGGVGYIEGTMMPTMLRDAQVLTIWEGTTNVLCHDFVRALLKHENKISPLKSLLKFFLESFRRIQLSVLRSSAVLDSIRQLVENYNELVKVLDKASSTGFKEHSQELRPICFGIARLFCGSLLHEQAALSMREYDAEVAARWVKRGLYIPENYSVESDLSLARRQRSGEGETTDRRGKIRAKF